MKISAVYLNLKISHMHGHWLSYLEMEPAIHCISAVCETTVGNTDIFVRRTSGFLDQFDNPSILWAKPIKFL